MRLFNIYFKQNAQFLISFLVGALLYLGMMVYIYPSIANMDYIDDLVKKMPKELIAIFNINTGLSNINSFVAMEYYGMIFIILMFCFSLILANNIYGKWITNQSMSVLLNMPMSRAQIMTVIQSTVIALHVLLGGLMAAGGIGLISLLADDAKYDRMDFINLNMLGVMLFLIFSLLTITCMLVMPNIKSGLTLGILISFLMYALSIISKLTKDTEWLKYLTLFTLNDSTKVSTGDANVMLAYSVYGAIIIALFVINIVLFRNKNLYL